jgi:MFS family permease
MIAFGSIGLTLSFITSNILFLKTMGDKKKGARLSIFVASMTSGYALGSAICSVLIHEFNLSSSIIFYCALPLHFIAFFLALGFPEAPIERFPIKHYIHDLKHLPAICIALVTFTLGTHWGSESYGMVRFMYEEISSTGYQMALFFVLTGIALSVFSRLAGHLVDTRGNMVHIVVPALIVSGFFHALTHYSRNFTDFLIIRLFHTCGDGAINFSVPMLVSLVFVSGRIGGNFGFSRTINSIGAAIGAGISGFIVARYANLGYPFLASGIFQFITAGILWKLRSHLPTAGEGPIPTQPPMPPPTAAMNPD